MGTIVSIVSLAWSVISYILGIVNKPKDPVQEVAKDAATITQAAVARPDDAAVDQWLSK